MAPPWRRVRSQEEVKEAGVKGGRILLTRPSLRRKLRVRLRPQCTMGDCGYGYQVGVSDRVGGGCAGGGGGGGGGGPYHDHQPPTCHRDLPGEWRRGACRLHLTCLSPPDLNPDLQPHLHTCPHLTLPPPPPPLPAPSCTPSPTEPSPPPVGSCHSTAAVMFKSATPHPGGQPCHTMSLPTSPIHLEHNTHNIGSLPLVQNLDLSLLEYHRSQVGGVISLEEPTNGIISLSASATTTNTTPTTSCPGDSAVDAGRHVTHAAVTHCNPFRDTGSMSETCLSQSPLLPTDTWIIIEGPPSIHPSLNIISSGRIPLGSFLQGPSLMEKESSDPHSIYPHSPLSIPTPPPSPCISQSFTSAPVSPSPPSRRPPVAYSSSRGSLICDHLTQPQFIYTPWRYRGRCKLLQQTTRGHPSLLSCLDREGCPSLCLEHLETNRPGVQASSWGSGGGLGVQASSWVSDRGLGVQASSWGFDRALGVQASSWGSGGGLGSWYIGDKWCWSSCQDMDIVSPIATAPSLDMVGYGSEIGLPQRPEDRYSYIDNVESKDSIQDSSIGNGICLSSQSQDTDSKAIDSCSNQASDLTVGMGFCLKLKPVPGNGDDYITSERPPCQALLLDSGMLSTNSDPHQHMDMSPVVRLDSSQTSLTQQARLQGVDSSHHVTSSSNTASPLELASCTTEGVVGEVPGSSNLTPTASTATLALTPAPSLDGLFDVIEPPEEHNTLCRSRIMSSISSRSSVSLGCIRSSFLNQFLLIALLLVSGGPIFPVPVSADEVVIKLGPPVPKVNAFITVGFDPTPQEVIKGVTVTEVVNVSITDAELAQRMDGKFWVWPCCPDPRVAIVVDPRPIELSSGGNLSTVLPITVRGVGLGRTSIRFLVYKNATYRASGEGDDIEDANRKDGDDIRPSSALLLSPGPVTHGHFPGDLADIETLNWNHSGATWMLMENYVVKVVKGEGEEAAFYLSLIVLVLTAANMVGIGGQVDGELMMHLLKNPVAISLNMICRFGIIPAVALGIVELLTPNMDSGLGALVLLTAPAEGASNLLVLLAEADLTLSVTVTCVTNFAAIGMLPLWTILFETQIYHNPGNVEIPFRYAFILFGYMVISLTAGFIFHRKFPIKYHHFWMYLPSLTIFTIIFCIIVEIYNAHYVFVFISKEIFFASVLLAACGASFGAIVAFVFQQPNEKILILTLEAGTRTTYFTSTLLMMSLKEPESDVAKTTSLLVTLFSLIPSFALVCLYRIYKRYTGKDFTDPIYAPTSSYSEEEIEEDVDVADMVLDEEGREVGRAPNGPTQKTEKCLPIVEVVDEKETCI